MNNPCPIIFEGNEEGKKEGGREKKKEAVKRVGHEVFRNPDAARVTFPPAVRVCMSVCV